MQGFKGKKKCDNYDHTYINYIDLAGKNFFINCSYYKYKQQTFHIFLRMKKLSKVGHYILEVALVIFTMTQGKSLIPSNIS